MAEVNPYEAPRVPDYPTAEFVEESVPPAVPVEIGVWRDGHLLVMHRRALLPERCVKSNGPVCPSGRTRSDGTGVVALRGRSIECRARSVERRREDATNRTHSTLQYSLFDIRYSLAFRLLPRRPDRPTSARRSLGTRGTRGRGACQGEP